MRAQRHHASGEEVHLAPHFLPAEQQHGEEAGFEKKGENALGGERAAKDVAHEAGVGGPVGAEFEFHHDARGHADGECQREDFGPKPRHLVVDGLAGFEPGAFHQYEHQPQADAQRRIDIMKSHRGAELDS